MFGRKMLTRHEQSQNKSVCECPALKDIYAKTKQNSDGIVPGQTIWIHSLLTGLVSRYLISLYPRSIRRRIFPDGTEAVVSFHDVGKISPVFAAKLLSHVTCNVPDWYEGVRKYQDFVHDSRFRHEVISGVFFSNKSWQISRIVGQHHGKFVTGAGLSIDCDVYGGRAWNIRRQQLEEKLSQIFCPSKLKPGDLYNSFNTISPAQLSAISGLTTISDWLASSDLLCAAYEADGEIQVLQKLEELGFKELTVKKNISFETMFGFKPNVIQQEFIDIIEPGGVFVLEAPMGIGKTEAALYAAYKVLLSDRATGIYFALPTQTTSEKIYERFTAFVDKFADLNSFACKLLHSKARYYELNNGTDSSEEFSWFNSSKRGLLVRFAVGTIDQALMSVLNVKHGFIRDFGLAGKVVILDEIHTYDCFTQVFVRELINRLRDLRCTVIILSATLKNSERFRLLNFDDSAENSLIDGYPALSWVKQNESDIYQKVLPAHLKSKNVLLSFRSMEDCVEEAVKRAAEGQQVLWIENTVKNAQNIYESVVNMSGSKSATVEIGLIHSKFTKADRSKLEDKWLNVLGKSATDAERLSKGRILVGTQILEQSIDIDADFLISRIAPSDMILQRMGRLWRHNRSRNGNARCEAWIIDVNLGDSLVAPADENNFGKSAYVYEPYVLNRSVETLKLLRHIRLPEDIPAIIDNTYRERDDISPWIELRDEMEHGTGYKKGSIQLNQKAAGMLSKNGVISSSTDDVCTRYSEEEDSSIIILRNYVVHDRAVELLFPDGTLVVIDKDADNYENTKKIILAIENSSVPCPVSKLPCRIAYSKAKKLGLTRYVHLGSHHDSDIDVAIMLCSEDGRLSNIKHSADDRHEYFYTDQKGLEIRRLN